MSERTDHAQVAIDMIDQALDQTPPTIKEALMEAVVNGRMSMDEAKECYGAYERTLGLEGQGCQLI